MKKELEYGMNTQSIKNLWDKVPTFKKYMSDVATIHVPMKQSLITQLLMMKMLWLAL